MRKNNFKITILMVMFLYMAVGLLLMVLPSKACPVETSNPKAARASYSNTVECSSNGCQIVNRKLIFWRPGLTPVLNWDGVPEEVKNIVISELQPFGILDGGDVVIPANTLPITGQIRIKSNPNLSPRGIAKRDVTYMTEKPSYWEAYRGDIEVRLTGLPIEEQAKVILHEICHALGLDHSEGSHQWTVQNGVQVSYNYPLNRIPIMYPNNFPSDGYLQHEDKVYIREALSLPSPFIFGSVRGIATIQGSPVKGMIVSLVSLTDQELNISAPVDPLANGSGEWFFNTVIPGKYYLKIHSQICRFGGAGSSVGAYDCSDAPIEGFRWWTGAGWSKDSSKRAVINVASGNLNYIQARKRR